MITCRSATVWTITSGGCLRSRRDALGDWRPRNFLLSRSIGQWFNRAHTIFFTAVLQDDGLSDASSVTVNELNAPALHGALAGGGPAEPAGDGRVLGGDRAVGGAEQQPHAAAPLSRELEPPGLDAR